MRNKTLPLSQNEMYSRLACLDGQHPLQKAVPESAVMYSVVELGKGQVAYFNFQLAKEMGLIAKDHPASMNDQLHEKLIETFAIQIVNEYDELHQRRVRRLVQKPHKFMATRYLQCQHKSKTGKTSGDGRGIWNGIVNFNGKTWDVSSRGTGVTRLSPGFSQLGGKPLKTGNNQVGYGCGRADLDELLASAVQAEIFHQKGLNTERVLCVIDTGQGYGIGVRASQNLLRPAHLFLYLKQNRLEELERMLTYFVDRQLGNQRLHIASKKRTRKRQLLGRKTKNQHPFHLFLKSYALEMAKFAAYLEENYIFVWMDWDGDNLLLDPGIIDYGSVRQFGSCHNEYRYDDVQRFSTSLKEQKDKARMLVRVMAQLVDTCVSKKKRPSPEYRKHWAVLLFNKEFQKAQKSYFVQKLGTGVHRQKLKNIEPLFRRLENWKVGKRPVEVADGIDNPPVLNMLRFIQLKQSSPDRTIGVYEVMTSFGKTAKLDKSKIDEFKELDRVMSSSLSSKIKNHNSNVPHEVPFSGNALIESIEMLLKDRKSGEDVTKQVDLLINPSPLGRKTQPKTMDRKQINFQTKVLKLRAEFEDDI